MREEHPKQAELPHLPAPFNAATKQAAAEVSDVAKLSADVIEKGLVREHRPVFVYDKKLANEKNSNAQRQEKHRQKLAQSGLTLAPVPTKIKAEVAAAGGWESWLNAKNVPAKEVAPVTEKAKTEAIAETISATFTSDLSQKTREELERTVRVLQEKLKRARDERPTTTIVRPVTTVVQAPIPVQSGVFLSAGEHSCLALGHRVLDKKGPTGWLVRWLLDAAL